MFSKLSGKIGPEELKELIIREVQTTRQGRKVTDVTFDVETVCVGYGMNESIERQFTGVTVHWTE